MPRGIDYEFRINRRAIDRYMRGGDVKLALQRMAQVVETSAKSHAPVRTGNLRRSITHEVSTDFKGPFARVGTNVRYAVFQELGTRHHPAHPFLRPALSELRRYLNG